jgi:hypothetical protein
MIVSHLLYKSILEPDQARMPEDTQPDVSSQVDAYWLRADRDDLIHGTQGFGRAVKKEELKNGIDFRVKQGIFEEIRKLEESVRLVPYPRPYSFLFSMLLILHLQHYAYKLLPCVLYSALSLCIILFVSLSNVFSCALLRL